MQALDATGVMWGHSKTTGRIMYKIPLNWLFPFGLMLCHQNRHEGGFLSRLLLLSAVHSLLLKVYN